MGDLPVTLSAKAFSWKGEEDQMNLSHSNLSMVRYDRRGHEDEGERWGTSTLCWRLGLPTSSGFLYLCKCVKYMLYLFRCIYCSIYIPPFFYDSTRDNICGLLRWSVLQVLTEPDQLGFRKTAPSCALQQCPWTLWSFVFVTWFNGVVYC